LHALLPAPFLPSELKEPGAQFGGFGHCWARSFRSVR